MACLSLILITNVTNLLSYPSVLVSDDEYDDDMTTTSVNSTNVNSSSSASSSRIVCTATEATYIATSLIAILMRIFMPFTVMVTLNALVLMRVRRSRRRVTTSSASTSSKRDVRFAVSTIVVDFMFLVFYTPLAGFLALSIASLVDANVWSPLTGALIDLFSSVAQLLAFAHSVALVFIFVACNRYFRNELVDLLVRLVRILGFGNQCHVQQSDSHIRVNQSHSK